MGRGKQARRGRLEGRGKKGEDGIQGLRWFVEKTMMQMVESDKGGERHVEPDGGWWVYGGAKDRRL